MKSIVAIAVAMGLALGTAWVPAASAAGKAAHEEQKVSLDQVPEAVKATFEKEAKGGTIGEVTKETDKKGHMVFEAQITKNGKDRYVNVREDGKVVKRESAKKE